jgi:hypothetical protein
MIFDTSGMDRDAKNECFIFFKSQVADDDVIRKEVEDEDFKFKTSNIEEIVMKYNLRNFVKLPATTKTVSPVLFYVKNKLDGEVQTLQLNDSMTYELKNSGLPINLPANQINKVCVSSGDIKQCIFVSSTPYFIKSFEVIFREGNKIVISKVLSSEAKRVLDYYRKN